MGVISSIIILMKGLTPVLGNKLQERFANSKPRDEYIYVVNYYAKLTNDKVVFLKRNLIELSLIIPEAFYQRPV